MRTKEEIVDAVNTLTSTQKSDIESIATRLKYISDNGKISIENYKIINISMKELDAIREYFVVRIINSLKRGNEI